MSERLIPLREAGQLQPGRHIRHNSQGAAHILGERVSVFVAEFDCRPAWHLDPGGRWVVLATVLLNGSWSIVEEMTDEA